MNRLLIVLALVVATSFAFGGPVAAQEESTPAHATCSYDKDTVKEYVPEYDIDHLDIQPTAIYSALFTSTEFSTDVYVYWALYPYQKGVTAEDSHAGDHEPVYVVIDKTDDDIERVQYSAYHYLKGVTMDPPTNESGHVQMHVNKPYHHYTPTSFSDGETPEIRDFCGAYDGWFANGWKASEEAVLNPWSMRTRGDWWERNELGFSLESVRWRIQQQLVRFAPFGGLGL